MEIAPFIVDSHVHVVSHDEAAYPLSPRPLSGEWYREAPASAEDLIELMDAAGVARAILVQPLGAYSYDNRYTADSAARHPGRFTSACCVDVDGEDPVAALGHWVCERGMRGVRLFALSTGESWLEDSRTFPLWERAAELDAHVIVTILAHQLPQLRSVLERFPEIRVSLDHCGFPDPAGMARPEGVPLFALAEHSNLYLKVSTHVLDAAARAGVGGDFVAALVERFGARRLMWGSDFCQTHDRSYGQLVRLGRDAFSRLSDGDRDWCLGLTARSLWRDLS